MIISRGLNVIRAANLLRKGVQVQGVRNSSHAWYYRVSPPPPPAGVTRSAEFVAAVFWWWVLWHMFTEPGHVFGEFEYPDASKWTDEELGIPSE